MGSAESDADLGPWNNADLGVTAKANAGIGADSNMPEAVRFCSNVSKLIRRRLAINVGSSEASLPAVFLLQPSPSLQGSSLSLKREPLLDSGTKPINARVWFVGAVAASGHFVPWGEDDDDELFKFVVDTLQLGSVPAIIFDPRHPESHLRHYPNGLVDTEKYEEFPLNSAAVTVESVTNAIHKTYAEKMKTPEAQPKAAKLWYNSKRFWPFSDAEDRVQMYLELALNTAFPTCTVRSEQTIPEGRLDIEIIENDPVDRSILSQHCILELKVLRSFGQTGSEYAEQHPVDWISSGVKQAAAYRDGKGAKWGALICFDMRSYDLGDEPCFAHVSAEAEALKVHLCRWFLYAASSHLRTALAAAKI